MFRTTCFLVYGISADDVSLHIAVKVFGGSSQIFLGNNYKKGHFSTRRLVATSPIRFRVRVRFAVVRGRTTLTQKFQAHLHSICIQAHATLTKELTPYLGSKLGYRFRFNARTSVSGSWLCRRRRSGRFSSTLWICFGTSLLSASIRWLQ